MDRSRSHHSVEDVERPRLFGFGRVNLALLGSGVVAVFSGYVLLGAGSTTAAPLLLLLGYGALVPSGLLWGFRGSGGTGTDEGE